MGIRSHPANTVLALRSLKTTSTTTTNNGCVAGSEYQYWKMTNDHTIIFVASVYACMPHETPPHTLMTRSHRVLQVAGVHSSASLAQVKPTVITSAGTRVLKCCTGGKFFTTRVWRLLSIYPFFSFLPASRVAGLAPDRQLTLNACLKEFTNEPQQMPGKKGVIGSWHLLNLPCHA